MDYFKLDKDLTLMQRRNRSLGLALGGLIAALLLCLISILHLTGAQRTILVPPAFDRTFWVSRDQVSAEYLEPMAGFMAWLILDVTPATIDWKKDVLLNYVAPDQYGAMKARQEVEAERLKRINASTFFLPQQLAANERDQSVIVRGRLRTQVNGQDTSTDAKAYLVQFRYAGGRIHLHTFKEITP